MARRERKLAAPIGYCAEVLTPPAGGVWSIVPLGGVGSGWVLFHAPVAFKHLSKAEVQRLKQEFKRSGEKNLVRQLSLHELYVRPHSPDIAAAAGVDRVPTTSSPGIRAIRMSVGRRSNRSLALAAFH